MTDVSKLTGSAAAHHAAKVAWQWGENWRPDIDAEGDWTGRWISETQDGEDREVFTEGEEYSADLAHYLAWLHNAAPALLTLWFEVSKGRRIAQALQALDELPQCPGSPNE